MSGLACTSNTDDELLRRNLIKLCLFNFPGLWALLCPGSVKFYNCPFVLYVYRPSWVSACCPMRMYLHHCQALAFICLIALFHFFILLGLGLWILLCIGYICLYHDFSGTVLVLPLCILTDVFISPLTYLWLFVRQ